MAALAHPGPALAAAFSAELAKSSSNLELARGGKLFVTPLPQFKISVCQFTPPVLPPRRTVSMGGSLSMAEAGRLAAPPC